MFGSMPQTQLNRSRTLGSCAVQRYVRRSIVWKPMLLLDVARQPGTLQTLARSTNIDMTHAPAACDRVTASWEEEAGDALDRLVLHART